MRDFFQDVRLGFRTLSKAPIVSLLAVLSLGVAIAGNSTVFSMVDAILLRPLPYHDPDRLVLLWEADPSNPLIGFTPTSPDNFLDFREGTSAFEELSGILPAAVGLTEGDRPEPLVGLAVSLGFFEILGEPAELGRTLQPSDYQPGSDHVVVLSQKLWQTRFAADRFLVGRTISLNGEAYQVAGIMADGFEFFDPRVDLWRPLVLRRGETPRDVKNMSVVGRLKRDVTIEEAREQLTVVAARLASEYPESNRDLSVLLRTFREQLASGGNTEIMSLLQGALFFVLLIASANIANLYLARGVDRQKEFAVRTAMGASRSRVIRQLLIEASVLAMAAGALGTMLSYWGIRLLAGAFGDQMSAAFAPRLDERVFLFSIAISLLAGLVFGIAPALSTARANLSGTLHEGGRAGTGAGRRLLTKGLVVAEVTLALVMLAGAGLLVRTFAAAQNLDAGISTDNVVVFEMELPGERYAEPSKRAAFFEELQRELSSLPGSHSATIVDHLPRSPFPPSVNFAIEGRTSEEERPSATVVTIDSGYLDVFRVPLFQGRSFSASDRMGASEVALVNEAMVRNHFTGQNPLGERIRLHQKSREIVGVVANVREDIFRFDADVSQPIIYLPQAQSPSPRVAVALRTEGDPLAVAGPVRDALSRLDSRLSAAELQTMDDFVAQFFVGMRVLNTILSGFGGVALLLAAIGIYGVIAFSVSRRTHEIGLRMALGARGLDVVRLVVREGLVLVVIGFAIGVPGTFLVSRAIAAALSGINAFGPSTVAAIAAGLFAVAFLACYIPARRAASLHPSVALRAE
ncbi:MAG TPA: ABC transporter permease [Vicinamibacteria bacterium]|nr:ABC transporter permease [Vicinamibacteria bacterium]